MTKNPASNPRLTIVGPIGFRRKKSVSHGIFSLGWLGPSEKCVLHDFLIFQFIELVTLKVYVQIAFQFMLHMLEMEFPCQ